MSQMPTTTAPWWGKPVTLDMRKVAMRVPLGAFAEHHLTAELVEDALGLASIHLQTFVLAEQLASDHRRVSEWIEVPASWWQHLKRDRAPAWVRKRWPVRNVRVTVNLSAHFERYATYPQASILPDRMGRAVIMESINSSVWFDPQPPTAVTNR